MRPASRREAILYRLAVALRSGAAMLAGIGAIGTVAAIIAGVVIAVREGQGYHPTAAVLTGWCVVGCSGFVMVVAAVITGYFASQSIDLLLERGMEQ